MGYAIPQGNTTEPIVFLLVSEADHITGLTGAAPTVTISKNGAPFATPSGGIGEIGNGLYKIFPNGADADTLGPLFVHAVAAGADPSDDQFDVEAVVEPSSTSDLGAPTVASTTSVVSAEDILRAAARLLFAVGSGQALTNEMAHDGLFMLNMLIDAWGCERDTHLGASRRVVDLIPNEQAYVTAPVYIDGAGFSVDGREREIRVFSPQEYREADKARTGPFPQAIFYNRAESRVYVLPTPTSADVSLILYIPTPIVRFPELTTQMALAKGYLRALVYNLALDWAPELGVETVPQRIQQVAAESLAAIKRTNEDVPLLGVDSALCWNHGRFDMQSGDC